MSVTARSKYLVGIDEAGRGPLAGPVAVGVVLIEHRELPKLERLFRGVKDSKQLSASQREEWLAQLRESQAEQLLRFASALVGNLQIDNQGIVAAIRLGIRRGLNRLAVSPRESEILLDGSLRAPASYLNQRTIIRGDESEMIIAFASIVAKVRRDHYMVALAKKFPQYGFEQHKGYGTAAHYRQIRQHGPTPCHRLSFLP
jgi:ribonuclease HII